MSLFKVTRWWHTQCPDVATNYDSWSLHCCRFGLVDNEKDYIVVGSHSGLLSIFKPTVQDTQSNEPDNNNTVENTNPDRFTHTDLLLEVNLSSPVLGILSGSFLGSNKDDAKTQLAILHPMKMSVYSVQITEGVAEHGNQSKLELCFEHKFKSAAFSFCKGHFGGVKRKEFLCVVYMNSLLSFYEQDGIAYESELPGIRNIPSAFLYVPRIDSFVIVNSAYEVECYRYQDLNQSNGKIEAAWSTCIGEFALDIATHQISKDESVIMILGENNFITLSDNGQIRFIKKLDYTPICFHTFVIGWYWEPNARLMAAICSESGSMLIYEESRLIWASQLNEVPVAIARSNIQGLPGAIVTLGNMGQLQVGFLGSEPYLFKVPALNLQELNYEKTQKELIELEKDIKAGIDLTDVSMTNAAAERNVQIQLVANEKLEKCKYPTKITSTADFDHNMCLVSLIVKASSRIEQIQVCFNVPEPLKCSKEIHFLSNMEDNSSERFDVWIYFEELLPVYSAKVTACISFVNNQSLCRILEKQISLPMTMFFKQFVPQKEAQLKITLSLENCKVLPSLDTIFAPDFVGSSAIGLKAQYGSQSIATIVAAKNSNRFRIQSNDLTVLGIVIEYLIDRLMSKAQDRSKVQAQSSNIEQMKIITMPNIPVEQTLEMIDKHFESRQKVNDIQKTLELSSAQMRLIQRRLFVKMEDKKHAALDGIKLLLKASQGQIVAILRQLEKAKSDLKIDQLKLSCAIALTFHMVRNLNLPSKITDGLCAVLVTPVTDWWSEGWEEMTSQSLDMLNYNGPLKKNKNISLDENPTFATTLDIGRFKRHLSSLVERVCRLAKQDDVTDKDDETLDESSEDTELDVDKTAETISEWINSSVSQPVDLLLNKEISS